jgi:hypothetical protein
MFLIRLVSNSNNEQTSSMQPQTLYQEVKNWEELIDIIENRCRLKKPYCLTALYKCHLTQEELDKEYMGLFTLGQILNDALYSQISCHSSLSNALKLNLGHNMPLFVFEMKTATGKHIEQHVIGPARLISASLLTVSYAPQLISILRLRRHPMKMKVS